MAEATHTQEIMFGLLPNNGRGGKIYAGYLQIDDGETLDTGMDLIYALVTTPVENFAADTPYAAVNAAATTGTATMSVGAWDDAAADAGSNHYVIAVGVVY